RLETQGAVQGNRLCHGRECVEPHFLVPKAAGLGDNLLGQSLTELPSSKLGPQVEPLHLTYGVAELAEGHAPGWSAALPSQEQATVRGRVIARQGGQLLLEVLEAQAYAQRSFILLE